MAVFAKAKPTQAFLKCGIMGFAGSGKTFTASEMAIGLWQHIGDAKLPVYFLDTETGADFVMPKFSSAGIEMRTAKTRAFVDLIPAVNEAAKTKGILIIDSISHFWRELTESYATKKKRTRGLQFQDWAWLKQEWGKFTDQFVNAPCHIIMCGRAGYEYDFFEQEGGKRELEKTGIKMKAETETGYEPSLLILMNRHQELDDAKGLRVWRSATVLKDRTNLLDGQVFRSPRFEDFKPHIEFLSLGGKQLGVDTSRTSEDIVPPDDPKWAIEKKQKEVVLDEIQAVLVKHHPSQTKDDKAAKGDLLERFFDTRAWKRVETYPLDRLQQSYEELFRHLEGEPDQDGYSEPVVKPEEAKEDAPF